MMQKKWKKVLTFGVALSMTASMMAGAGAAVATGAIEEESLPVDGLVAAAVMTTAETPAAEEIPTTDPPAQETPTEESPTPEVPPTTETPPATEEVPEAPAVEETPVVEEPPAQEAVPPTTEGTPPVTKAPALTTAHVSYIAGYPNGNFGPNDTLTRAQAAQMVYRLLEDQTMGSGTCSYTDVDSNAWYGQVVYTLRSIGLLADGTTFRPDESMTRAEFVQLLTEFAPNAEGRAHFSDVGVNHWAAAEIGSAVSLGWIAGYPDGTFRPESGLTRAEACTILNRATGRTGDLSQGKRLLELGLFPDVSTSFWAGQIIAEAAVAHDPQTTAQGETWTSVKLDNLTFSTGMHELSDGLYYVDRNGKLIHSSTLGAYSADATGRLTQISAGYQLSYVPYISQIDGIYAWVGCESVSAIMGLKAKGFAGGVGVQYFLNALPRTTSNPEKGFVGSPYVPDKTKKTRTTIYPAALANYCNTYCGGATVCADFRGATVTQLQRELLAGNPVVAYETLWWKDPQYRAYDIEGNTQWLVSNNHAVLVYGYDPNKGYLISDPYNYYNRGQVHQYWENAATFESIWNKRMVGMVLR